MNVLVIGGVAEHLGKKSEVQHIEICQGIGALYQLKDFPTELGLALFFSEDQLVFLDGPVKVPAKTLEPKRV